MRERPIMQADLEAGSNQHLLQILYSLRVIKISQAKLDSSNLHSVLETIINEGSRAVADEASIIFSKLFAENRKRNDDSDMDETRARRKQNMDASMINDTATIEYPQGDHIGEKVKIAVKIHHWGIKYHSNECFLYVKGVQALFIMYCNSLATLPQKDYVGFFKGPRLALELCSRIYTVTQRLENKNELISYIPFLDLIWNEGHTNDVIIVEEDLVEHYPLIQREMNALDKIHGAPANVNLFGMNNFMENLAIRHSLWTTKNENKDYLYGLQMDLEMAGYRAEQLWDDKEIEKKVERNELPRISIGSCPEGQSVQELKEEDVK